MAIDGLARVRETDSKSKHLGAASQAMSWPTSGRSRDDANRVTWACGNFVEQPLGVALGHSPSVENQHFILFPQTKFNSSLRRFPPSPRVVVPLLTGIQKPNAFVVRLAHTSPLHGAQSNAWTVVPHPSCRFEPCPTPNTVPTCAVARPRPERGPSSCCAGHERSALHKKHGILYFSIRPALPQKNLVSLVI